MEGFEAFLEGEWESLSKLFSCEDSELVLHSNGGADFFESSFDFCYANGNDASLFNSCFYSVSQESSHSSTFDHSSIDLMEEVQLKRKLEDEDDDNNNNNNYNNSSRTPRSKKAKKAGRETTIDSNIVQSSSSEEESTAKAKGRKSRATDPQSLYARKRRERINERLRILQNLVPNGTKVDISTMLEEAVHYVKFLQLQIKLLSSDDKWMYAPIAYNGMDIGLYQKIVPNV